MKKFFLLAMMAMFSVAAIAQKDPNAKKILDNVSAKLKTFKGVTANFNFVSKTRTGKVNNNAAGNIAIKGNKYYIKQGGSEIFSNGTKSWNYNGDNEVVVSNVDADGSALTPQKLLTNFYDKDFNYRLVSSAGNAYEIQMTPVDKRKNFQQVNVFVDKAKMMITRAKVLDKSNNTIEFSLKNINTNASVPESTFVFNKNKYNKQIEVIE